MGPAVFLWGGFGVICVRGVLFALVEFYLRSRSFICAQRTLFAFAHQLFAFNKIRHRKRIPTPLVSCFSHREKRPFFWHPSFTLAWRNLHALVAGNARSRGRYARSTKAGTKTRNLNPISDASRCAESDTPQPKKAPGFPGAFIIQVPQNVTYGLSGSAGGCV